MLELKTMIDQKFPHATRTKWYRENSWRLIHQYQQLQRLRNRRPELYKEAIIGLVNWVGKRTEADVEALRKQRAIALEASYDD